LAREFVANDIVDLVVAKKLDVTSVKIGSFDSDIGVYAFAHDAENSIMVGLESVDLIAVGEVAGQFTETLGLGGLTSPIGVELSGDIFVDGKAIGLVKELLADIFGHEVSLTG
jgi:hypothetical protein